MDEPSKVVGEVMKSGLLLLLVATLASCSTGGGPERTGNALPYSCDDLAVIGRVTTTQSQETSSDGLLGELRWTLRVDIKRVVHGTERRKEIPAVAISHAQLRDDKDFLIVLTPTQGGSYSLQSAMVWSDIPRPRLAEPCSPSGS